MELGEKIRLRREEMELSQIELANLVEANSTTVISNWEKGKNKPDLDKFSKMCKVLNCPADYFLETNTDESVRLTEAEIKWIQNMRSIDSIGKDTVINALEHQLHRCREKVGRDDHEKNEVITLTIEPVSGPIFINKNHNQYLEIKEKIPELRKLKNKTYLTELEICRHLHLKGYNKKINIADLIMLFRGIKIPSPKLFDDIEMYLRFILGLYNNN